MILPPIITTWQRSPNTALSTRFEEGKMQWQLFLPSSSKDDLEVGNRVAVCLKLENEGPDWVREDAVIVRGMDALPGTPFADFLEEFASRREGVSRPHYSLPVPDASA